MQSGSFEKFSGRVEADETYIGGKARFMHKHKRTGKTGMVGKIAVLGLLERGTDEKASRVRERNLLGHLSQIYYYPCYSRAHSSGAALK